MKTNSVLQRRTPLKTYTHLTARVGLRKTSGLARSGFKRKSELTPRQQLDSIVSQCIRLGNADTQGMVRCVTCLSVEHWKEIQCGHFQKREHTATRYEPKNLAPQCEDCNCFNDGENEKFAKFIDDHYGPGTADSLRCKAREIVHDFPYPQEIAKWMQVLNTLKESRSNEIQY